MEDPDAEHAVQIFLFGATLFCYILLFVFLAYALYSCLMKNCVNKCRERRERRRRLREIERRDREDRTRKNLHEVVGDNVGLFVSNEKKVTIVSKSEEGISSKSILNNNLNNNNATRGSSNSQNNTGHFVNEKYYQIFKA